MNDSKHFLHMGTYAFGARDYFFTSDFKKWFVQNFMSLIPITRGKLKENELSMLEYILSYRSDRYRHGNSQAAASDKYSHKSNKTDPIQK